MHATAAITKMPMKHCYEEIQGNGYVWQGKTKHWLVMSFELLVKPWEKYRPDQVCQEAAFSFLQC